MRIRRLKAPVDAGLGVGGMKALYIFALLGVAKAASLAIFAESLAVGISSVVAHTSAWRSALVWGLVAAAMRAGLAWISSVAAVRAAAGTKELVRGRLVDRVLAGASAPVGSTALLGTRGLDELDNYYRFVLPALANAAVIPAILGARILFADWLSAVIIAVTIALVPLFMALIGMHTNERTAVATASLGRLSDHLVELAKGLPVLVGLSRADDQVHALREISDDYRHKTLSTLRVAFLSALALELISTISVAVVAVSIGFRLVNGTVTLEVALLVLILAPECFAPFRDLGAAFHASRNGLNALRAAQDIIEQPLATPMLLEDGDARVQSLSVRFAGRTDWALRDLTFTIPRGQITSIEGPSGSGKSTLLAALTGGLADGVEGATVLGTVHGIDPTRVAFQSQSPRFVGESVVQELRLYTGPTINEQEIAGILSSLGLSELADTDPEQLSPGEARRVALARTILRTHSGADVVVFDEPTAHLDDATARVVAGMIADLRGTATVVVVSHDAAITGLATRHFLLRGGSSQYHAASNFSPVAAARDQLQRHNHDLVPSIGARLSGLIAFLRPALGRYIAAAVLGTLAALFAMSLTAVSGWLIVRASEHPDVMYLLVAIVGVRFFGIGRSALRYSERLVTHDAVFESLTRFRVRLWKALTRQGATSRKLLRGGTVLDHLVGSTDEVRDLAPRVVIPLAVGLASAGAVVLSVAIIFAPAVLIVTLCASVCLKVAPAITICADRSSGSRSVAVRGRMLRRFAAIVDAAADLRANGIGDRARAALAREETIARDTANRGAWALGSGNALVVAACCCTSVLMLLIAQPSVAAGSLSPALVAVLAFIPLGLIEPMLAYVESIQRVPALLTALGSSAVLGKVFSATAKGSIVLRDPIASIRLEGASARWPGAQTATFNGVSAAVSRGQWLIVEGPSGSGKSTLLTLLMGYLSATDGSYLVNGIDSVLLEPASLRSRISWAPQDGHLFDSSLRANLLIARSRDDRPTDMEIMDVLRRVGLGDLLRTMPAGLDTPVGPGGAYLSGGQRQRVVVARSLLTPAEVILLDEPTAHLDVDSAQSMMQDLRRALSDRIVVMVTHHAEDVMSSDRRLRLGPSDRFESVGMSLVVSGW